MLICEGSVTKKQYSYKGQTLTLDINYSCCVCVCVSKCFGMMYSNILDKN